MPPTAHRPVLDNGEQSLAAGGIGFGQNLLREIRIVPTDDGVFDETATPFGDLLLNLFAVQELLIVPKAHRAEFAKLLGAGTFLRRFMTLSVTQSLRFSRENRESLKVNIAENAFFSLSTRQLLKLLWGAHPATCSPSTGNSATFTNDVNSRVTCNKRNPHGVGKSLWVNSILWSWLRKVRASLMSADERNRG